MSTSCQIRRTAPASVAALAMVVLLAPDARAAFQVECDQAGAQLGRSVVALDANGDGLMDVVAGAPAWTQAGMRAGAVFLYLNTGSGLAATPAWTATGAGAGALFGWSIALAGDVNHDGQADLLVGSPGYSAGQESEGAALLFLGDGTSFGSSPAWTWQSDQAGAKAGFSVAGLGAVDGDFVDDVAVGVPGWDLPFVDGGLVAVFRGDSVTGLSLGPAWQVPSDQAGAQLGRAVCGPGDVNGDHRADVVMGAPMRTEGDMTRCGRVWSWSASPSGVVTMPSVLMDGWQGNAFLGMSVAAAGDLDLDGLADVLVGAPMAVVGDDAIGVIFLVPGSATNGSGGGPAWKTTTLHDDHLGCASAAVGDFNRDGWPDVAVGARRHDAGSGDEGRVDVYAGGPSGLDPSPCFLAEGDAVEAFHGTSIAAAGDFDGDGFADVISGAPWAGDLYREGRVTVHLGAP